MNKEEEEYNKFVKECFEEREKRFLKNVKQKADEKDFEKVMDLISKGYVQTSRRYKRLSLKDPSDPFNVNKFVCVELNYAEFEAYKQIKREKGNQNGK